VTDWPPERLKKLGQDALSRPHAVEAELAAQEEARRRIEELLSRERAIESLDRFTDAIERGIDVMEGLTRELENLRNEDNEDDWRQA
jgi:hypothetical protein